jgi:NhaP-type Na+/H+ or K+/H+ antiporter
MFKDHGLEGRLRLLVESESPFKDGVAAVLFVAALSWAQGDGGGPASFETAGALARIAFGGVAIGILCAGATISGRLAHIGTHDRSRSDDRRRLRLFFHCRAILGRLFSYLALSERGSAPTTHAMPEAAVP